MRLHIDIKDYIRYILILYKKEYKTLVMITGYVYEPLKLAPLAMCSSISAMLQEKKSYKCLQYVYVHVASVELWGHLTLACTKKVESLKSCN